MARHTLLELSRSARSRAEDLADAARSRAIALGAWLSNEARQIVDVAQWRSADTLHERAAAVSWPRAGVASGLAVALVGGLIWVSMPRGIRAYPPPLPTERELELRRVAISQFKSTPPPGLAAANRSVSQERP